MRQATLLGFVTGVLVMGAVFGNVVSLKSASAGESERDKVVVAHRGASAYLPEHTLPAVAMAYAMGADYMEQDVVMTGDDELIVWHDLTLNRTTDVEARFPQRARENGLHYVIDFTLEELRKLRLTEAYLNNERGEQQPIYPQRFPLWQSRFQVHTLGEQIEMVQGLNKSTGQDIGIYPEIKSPAFHREHGKDISMAMLEKLKHYGYTSPESNVFLQTFDFAELRRVHEELFPRLDMELKLVQLIGGGGAYRWMLDAEGMAQLSRYADGIGPHYSLIIADASTRNRIETTELVSLAHHHGMEVHPYTFRADPGQLPGYADNFEHMLELFYFHANVDGVFTDHADRVVDFLESRD